MYQDVTPEVLSLHVALALLEHEHYPFIHKYKHMAMHLLVYVYSCEMLKFNHVYA